MRHLAGLLLFANACGGTEGTGTAFGTGTQASTGASAAATDATAASSSNPDGDTASASYHPAGFAAPAVHGLETKLGEQDCRTCHGNELDGDGISDTSCDTCHSDGWRTNCVYCHGGDTTQDGAPGRDIDGTTELLDLSFRAHTAHVTEQNHAPFGCEQCHAQPDNVLTQGHLFDATPAFAEVELLFGLSPAGIYAAGTCGNLYCHGTGRGPDGAASHDMGALSCSGCHADQSTPQQWETMSRGHALHLGEAIECGQCHLNVVTGNATIVNATKHVDGVADVLMAEPLMSINANGCTGLCHLQAHFDEAW